MSRQLTAIMFTDVAGFTSLMGTNEQKALQLLEKNRALQKGMIEKYHGVWLKEVGDGIWACFSSSLNAVYCGNAILEAIKTDPDLNLSVVVHSGEIVFSNGDVFGDGVNIAARMETVAKAGQITISGAVYDNIKNIEGVRLEFEEEMTFKNVETPVKLYQAIVDKEFPPSEPRPSLSSLKKEIKIPQLTPAFQKFEEIFITSGGVFGAYRHGWRQMWKHFLVLFLMVIVLAFAEIPLGAFAPDEENPLSGVITFQVFAFLFWLLVSAPLEYGSLYVFLTAVKGGEPAITDLKIGFYYYVNVILARILVTAVVGIGIAMLIIPGIIFACKLSFVPYLVVDKGMDAVQAAKTSWKMTNGYSWTIFGAAILAIPIVIMGLVAMGVGILISIMWVSAAFATIYLRADQNIRKKEASEYERNAA